MPTAHPPLVAWLRTHHGVVPGHQLGSLGVSRGALATLLKCGELIGVREGVYRHVLWPDTFLSQCAGLCAADPAIVVTCGGAAQIWRYRRCSRVGLHVSGTGTGLRFDDGPVHHRCPIMPAEHIHPATMASASPVRPGQSSTCPNTSGRDIESVIEQGLRRSLFDIPTLYGVGACCAAWSTRIGRVRRSAVIEAHVAPTCGLASGNRVAPGTERCWCAPRATTLLDAGRRQDSPPGPRRSGCSLLHRDRRSRMARWPTRRHLRPPA